MGSLFGGGSAKRAALRQAKATTDAANDAAAANNYQAEAAANQMVLAQELKAAQDYADNLLATNPIGVADVRLSTDATGEDDLLGGNVDPLRRRRTTRDTYRSNNVSDDLLS